MDFCTSNRPTTSYYIQNRIIVSTSTILHRKTPQTSFKLFIESPPSKKFCISTIISTVIISINTMPGIFLICHYPFVSTNIIKPFSLFDSLKRILFLLPRLQNNISLIINYNTFGSKIINLPINLQLHICH